MADDLLFEQLYYDAYRSGLAHGARLGGGEVPDELPEDVDQSLRRRARQQAAQLKKMVVDGPEAQQRLADTVNEWMAQEGQLDLNDLREALAPEFGMARALTIARTETAWAFNTANAAALRGNGWKKVRWIAALDACEACQALDGKVMSLEEYEEQAVLHPNCACTCEPADDDAEEDADLDEAAAAVDAAPGDLGAGDFDRAAPVAASGE